MSRGNEESAIESTTTRVVHAGNRRPRAGGSAVPPIHQSTVWELDGSGDISYIRYGNLPEHRTVVRRLVELEGAAAGLVTGSGMAAIVAAVLGLVEAGQTVLVDACPYGGTRALAERWLPRWGIPTAFVDTAADPSTWPEPPDRARLLFLESVSNPLLRVPDLPAVTTWARDRGILTVVDNTFPTPLGLRPLEHGADLVVHSGTKALNGHSDLVAGVVVGADAEQVERVGEAARILGAALDPHACFLFERGLRTLALRFAAQEEGASLIADRLAADDRVRAAIYPGRTDHPDHERARRLLDGYGTMLAFEMEGGLPAVDAFLDALDLVTPAPSLGGVETLAISPARTSHVGLDPGVRRSLGVVDGLVRVSVGIEDPEDLWRDLDRALGAST